MLSLRAPTDDQLAAFVGAQAQAELSYLEVGATRGGPPPGYTVDRTREVVGPASAFDRARAVIETWGMHRGAGMRVFPLEPPREGLTVGLAAPAFGFAEFGTWATSACRVVYVVDEPDRYGFAYGTLADHPVSGEERFTLERRGDEIGMSLYAFSRPASMLFRLGGPIARRKQLALGAAYLEALRRALA